MSNDGHRFDTAQIDPARHRALEERLRRKHKKYREHRIPHWVYRVILILILSVLAVLGWYNRQNLTPSNVITWIQERVVGMGIGDGFPQELSGSSVLQQNFMCRNKNIIIASDTSLTVLNGTAKKLLDRQHSFSTPILKAAGTRTLLYNLGGKGCQIDSIGKTLTKFSTKRDIIAGALAPNGRYALITSEDGYCGLLTAYTADSRKKSYYWFSEYYPTAVALNSDGTQAAVTGVSAKDGELVSALYILDLNSGKTVQPFAVSSGNLFFAVFWDKDSTINAIGDQSSMVIHPAAKSKSEFSYGGMKLTAYAADQGRTVLGLSRYTGSGAPKLVVLDSSGRQIFSEEMQKTITSVSIYGQAAAALSGGKVRFYSLAAGKPDGDQDAGNDSKAIALRDERSAYVLGVSEIRLVNNR